MQGDSPVEIADDLGHNVSMTLDTYSHVVGEYRYLPPELRNSMESLTIHARRKAESEKSGRDLDATDEEGGRLRV
jgi:hypothetical protein